MSVVHSLRVLRRLTLIDIQQSFMYRADMAFFALSTIALPIVSLLIWQAALVSGAKLPVDKGYLSTYFVLLGLVSLLTSSWLFGFLGQHIRQGDLNSWLIRPASTLLQFIANNLAEKTMKLFFVVPVAALVWWFFRDSVTIPGDPLRWTLFLVSILMAGTLVFVLDVIVGALAFWLDEVIAIGRGLRMVGAVLSGQLIPLALMPGWAQGAVDVQPFRFMLSFPIEIVAGGLVGRELVTGLALQLGYTTLACVGAWALWRRGLKSYSAVGA